MPAETYRSFYGYGTSYTAVSLGSYDDWDFYYMAHGPMYESDKYRLSEFLMQGGWKPIREMRTNQLVRAIKRIKEKKTVLGQDSKIISLEKELERRRTNGNT